jgi:hypothetical protein
MRWFDATKRMLRSLNILFRPSGKAAQKSEEEQLKEQLDHCSVYRRLCLTFQTDRLVRRPAQDAISSCLKRHASLEAEAKGGIPALILHAKATALKEEYSKAIELSDADKYAARAAMGDLQVCLCRLRGLPPPDSNADYARYKALVDRAQAALLAGEFETVSLLSKQCTAECEHECYVRSWQHSVKELASWRKADGELGELTDNWQMPESVATTRSEELIHRSAQLGWTPLQTILALCTHERMISRNPPVLRRQEFVYVPLKDYERVAALADARVKYSEEHFGVNSPERLSALLSFAQATHGRAKYSIPRFLENAKEHAHRLEWEQTLFDKSFAAVLEALKIADAAFGEDKRTERVLAIAAFTARRSNYPLPDGCSKRLKDARDKITNEQRSRA